MVGLGEGRTPARNDFQLFLGGGGEGRQGLHPICRNQTKEMGSHIKHEIPILRDKEQRLLSEGDIKLNTNVSD